MAIPQQQQFNLFPNIFFYGRELPKNSADVFTDEVGPKDYLNEIERRRVQMGWTDRHAADQLASGLRGKAREWLVTCLPMSRGDSGQQEVEEIRSSYRRLRSEFEISFKPKPTEVLFLDLQSIQYQNSHENPREYTLRVGSEIYTKSNDSIMAALTECDADFLDLDNDSAEYDIAVNEYRAKMQEIKNADPVTDRLLQEAETLAKRCTLVDRKFIGQKYGHRTAYRLINKMGKDIAISGLHHNELRKHAREFTADTKARAIMDFAEMLQTKADNIGLGRYPSEYKNSTAGARRNFNNKFPPRNGRANAVEDETALEDVEALDKGAKSKKSCTYCKSKGFRGIGHTEKECRTKVKDANKKKKNGNTASVNEEQPQAGPTSYRGDYCEALNFQGAW